MANGRLSLARESPGTVTVVRDLRIQKGANKAHLLECDDRRTYIVKFNDATSPW